MTEVQLITKGQAYVAANLSDATLRVFQTTEIADPNLPNQKTTQFEAAPTGQTVNLMKMGLQPMSDEAIERAGLDSLVSYQVCYCEPVTVVPEGKVRIANHPIAANNQDYRVQSVESWHGVYSKLILERL